MRGTIIAVECARCAIYAEIARKDVIARFKATAALSSVRRRLVGACEHMCVDGVDKCGARLSAFNRLPGTENTSDGETGDGIHVSP